MPPNEPHAPPRDTADNISNDLLLQKSTVITNVRLPHPDPDEASKLWKVECHGGRVSTVASLRSPERINLDQKKYIIDAKGSLMLPSLCHSHIHLDKCFILDRCGELITGNFGEALKLTGKAKSTFPLDLEDLYNRGARLIRESVECGVTSMRAHVEVDQIVGFACLDVALKLQSEYRAICDVQIAVFAQEPLFDSPDDIETGPNFTLLKQASEIEGVTVVGSAPYVEPSIKQAKINIALILKLAGSAGHHADFHLDYNLDPTSEPLIYEVIAQVQNTIHYWRPADGVAQRCIAIGHATRLQMFTPVQWHDLIETIKDLPIIFIGLPQSDLYMGRGDHELPLGPPRGTLRVPFLAATYGLHVAMSVNNTENAFTPQGSLDPLSLCTFGVAVFQAATAKDIRVLIESVTLTSKLAIGSSEIHKDLFPTQEDPADFVIVHGCESLRSAVLRPGYDRTTIKAGLVVSRRQTDRWLLGTET